jgi:alkylhydroperoxidase/carboxymuconolactone decarboxylase family protein YurZ
MCKLLCIISLFFFTFAAIATEKKCIELMTPTMNLNIQRTEELEATKRSGFDLNDFRSVIHELSPSDMHFITSKIMSSIDSVKTDTQPLNINDSARESALTSAIDAVMSPSSEERQKLIRELLSMKTISRNELEETLLWSTPFAGFPSAMAALADYRQVLGEERSQEPKPQPASVMNLLYGVEAANDVYNRLEFISHRFNLLCQDIAYGKYWSDTHLDIFNKSALTITTLMLLGREEQLQIHLRGFKNIGGTIDEVRSIVRFLKEHRTQLNMLKIENALEQVYGTSGRGSEIKYDITRVKDVLNYVAGKYEHPGMNRQFSVYAGGFRKPSDIFHQTGE